MRLATLPIASGVMLALAFPPGALQFLAWVALVPLGLALRDRRNWPELYVGMYLGGLAFHLIHVDWLRSGGGASWLSGHRATQWLVQGMLLALAWPLALSIGRVFIHRSRLPMAFALPVVWTAFEFARRHLWAIFDSTGYPYGQLGLTQAHHAPLIQIADIGGVYAVTAVIAAVNGLAVDAILCRVALRHGLGGQPPVASAASVTLVVTATLLYGCWRLSQTTPRDGPVVCLMPRVSSFALQKGDRGDLHASGRDNRVLAAAAALRQLPESASERERPDLLIWSEVAYPRPVSLARPEAQSGNEGGPVNDEPSGNEPQARPAEMEQFARFADAALVVGCSRLDGVSPRYNSAVVVDPNRRCLGAYDKIRLVPFSEFHPPWRPTFGPANRDRFTHGSRYPSFRIEGDETHNEFNFAIAICYDTCFPEILRRYMHPETGQPAPDFFAVPACEGHDVRVRLQRQLLDMARFRAIECRRPIVRNAEAGYSGIIDGNGTLIAEPAKIDFTEPVILGRTPVDDRTSLYAHAGDWLPIAACVAILFGAMRHVIVGHRKAAGHGAAATKTDGATFAAL